MIRNRCVPLLAAILALSLYANGSASEPPIGAYATAVHGVAAQLRQAARERGGSVPDVHVPPAPLPGPPRFAPALDGWLQSALDELHQEKKAKLHGSHGKTLRQIADALDEAVAQMRRQAAAQAVVPHDPRSAAAAILARAEYHHGPTTSSAAPDVPWWVKVLDWISQRLDALMRGLMAASSRTGADWVVLILLVGGLVAAVALVVVRLTRYIVSRPKRPGGTHDGEPLPAPADVDALFDAARAAAARGDFRRAATGLFRAAIAQLDRAHAVPLDQARTAGEYRRIVRRSVAPAASAFEAIASAFTLAAYAERTLGEPDWRAAADAYARFTASLAPQQR